MEQLGTDRHNNYYDGWSGKGTSLVSCMVKVVTSSYSYYTTGNTRSILGGCSTGSVGGLVWPWWAVDRCLLSA